MGLKVIKPHGSINWSHHISSLPVGVPKNEEDYVPIMIENAKVLGIDSTIDIRQSARDPKYPALAIPVETKSDYECPKEHLEALWEFLPSVKIVITVGWRAGEQHFMEKLVQGLPYDVIVQIVSSGKQSAEGIKEHMRQLGVKGEIFAAPAPGFTEFETKADAERFLNQMTAKLGINPRR